VRAVATQVGLFLCILLGSLIPQFHVAAGSPDVGAAAFASAQRQLGSMRGDYFVPNALVSEQLSMGLGIPNPIRRSSGGINLVSGCRIHSCDEKAAIVATNDGRALAVSLIYFPCHNQRGKSGRIREVCEGKPRQDIFLERRSVDAENDLRAWAQRESGPMQVEVRIIR
jgi:hypothetical protein